MQTPDPYVVDRSKILEPPTSFRGMLRHLGPGFVLSASIVGSGELVATTALGAKAGFIALWVILVSCLVKVAVQVEFGKRTITSGQTTFSLFNTLPGPKVKGASWTVWIWLFLMLFKFLQVGGIVGMVAVLLNMAMPALGEVVWLWAIVIVIAFIVGRGYYRLIEGLSVVMIGLFTLFTLISLVALQLGDSAFSFADVMAGLRFDIPDDKKIMLAVIGAFGITGVGGDEIMAYNYWLIEKGYAAHTGPRDDSEEWARRARGWIRVMRFDALAAMTVYTVMTAAFYLLGAAMLHGRGEVPGGGGDFLKHLAGMYTGTLGGWAGPFFYFGAFIVLFSTAFSALAAWTRQFTDAFGKIGLLDFSNRQARQRWIVALACIIPSLWAAVYLLIKKPVFMVFVGGFVTSIILLVVLFAVFIFKYRQTEARLKSGRAFDVWFWGSAVMILFVGIWSVTDSIRKGKEELNKTQAPVEESPAKPD